MIVQSAGYSQLSRLRGVLPSIRSVAIEVDAMGRSIKLVRLERNQYRPLETPLSPADISFAVDAPWFGGPIVGNRRGMFLMDRDGHLAKFDVQGLGAVSFGQDPVRVPIAIERFRTIYLWSNSWFRITPERQWLPIRGLPRDAFINAKFDPGFGEALLATNKGVFALDQDGSARELGGSDAAGRGRFRSLVMAPGGGAVLAGGAEGLFRIDLPTYRMQPVSNGSSDVIGDVRLITRSEYSDLAIVEASNGTYAFTREGLQVIRDLAAPGNFSKVFVFGSLRRMFVTKRQDSGPVLYELGQRNAVGVCARE
jgi:hypothetical protein